MQLFRCRRNRILISVASLLLACLLSAGLFLHYAAERHAEQEVRQHGELLLQQTSLLARPLLLANDRVSLNYLLNELVMLPYIRAAQLHDDREGTVARAGEAGGLEMQRPLAPDNLSQLTFWLDPAPLAAPLQRQLMQSGLFALLTLLATLLSLGWLLRERAPLAEQQSPAEPAAADSAFAAGPQVETQPYDEPEFPATEAPYADYRTSEPTEKNALDALTVVQAEPASEPAFEADSALSDQMAAQYAEADQIDAAEQRRTSAAPEHQCSDEAEVPEENIPFISDIVRDEGQFSPSIEPAYATESAQRTQPWNHYEPSSEPQDVALAEIEEHPAAKPTSDEQSARRLEPSFETDSLVQLLRPEQRGRTMPQFQPSSQPDEEPAQPAEADAEQPFDLDEQELDRDRQPGHATATATADTVKTRNPLKALREEVQLDLYTLEQELELILPGDEAGYCLYIDVASSHGGNVEESERLQLLKVYARMAGQSAAIYGGTAHQLANGDLRVNFDRPGANDNHGVNAVCAALLFNLLYKGYNQARIRAFLPVMNLHMALARGRLDKPELLLEEARFLTRTTQSNELISHTALTEVPDLKRNLLGTADVRREDEDKVLILKLSGHYQELLQKQANHLLNKLLA
ncbi:hypothetical protein [Marinobacterium arenosum]|uniref:hypothetical protein n=1 Tax=Marinobacterium arenosum TaxID=2862496 RepID=UPI001C98527B|nr:hypothetical protein [Marinobacterium arenosum]MBY4676202.1 hypothetical protein [Marinobacterium arenosum]